MKIKVCGIKPGCRAECSCYKYREDIKVRQCTSVAPCSMQVQIDAPEEKEEKK